MRLSIRLYSTHPANADRRHFEPVISAVDFSSAVEVSRTVGPANWFAINKSLLDGQNVSSPRKDISRVRYTEPARIAELAREGSVVTVSYALTKSERLGALSQAIGTQVPAEARGFFLSSASFTFGPSDIVEFYEDAEGEDEVRLVTVAYFGFVISCDNYPGRIDLLASSLDSVPEFVGLRKDLETIVGPLSLQLS